MKLQVIIQTLTCRKQTQSTRRPKCRSVLLFIVKKLHIFTFYGSRCSFPFSFATVMRQKENSNRLCVAPIRQTCAGSRLRRWKSLHNAIVGADQLGSPVLVLVPSEDIGTHYINNRMAQWRSWVSNIRPWTFIRSTPALIQKAQKVKHCVIDHIPERLHCCAGGSPSPAPLSGSPAEQHSQTQQQIAGCYTHRRTLQQREGLKLTVFLKIIHKKVFFFFCVFFSPLLTKWPFFILYEQLPDDAHLPRSVLTAAFYIKAARLGLFFFSFSTPSEKAFRWSSETAAHWIRELPTKKRFANFAPILRSWQSLRQEF